MHWNKNLNMYEIVVPNFGTLTEFLRLKNKMIIYIYNYIISIFILTELGG